MFGNVVQMFLPGSRKQPDYEGLHTRSKAGITLVLLGKVAGLLIV